MPPGFAPENSIHCRRYIFERITASKLNMCRLFPCHWSLTTQYNNYRPSPYLAPGTVTNVGGCEAYQRMSTVSLQSTWYPRVNQYSKETEIQL